MKEKRTLNVSFNKSGSGSISTKLNIPITWMRELGVSPEDREVEVTLEDDKIIISKKK
ncbi:AbrB/MazE/SpoVT family DNA-binding domain-containing protein [Romboutsia sedimentorum]|uniref:AbrB/MazE/SpoVT family DNA-binding domain-containing protein n=1 Tax=Romboutsia sedimentorum TaxID=1368474 RepID=UPI0024DE12D1|nr:AbrB/MazE/SpoVT family DNA-binding domain-containing protein [Romboutsia sedimentorum]MDK2587293.1 AbrB/MazE/SpoVT family DNA-binding domain-containing protein [Romboutsia sedimentorum]